MATQWLVLSDMTPIGNAIVIETADESNKAYGAQNLDGVLLLNWANGCLTDSEGVRISDAAAGDPLEPETAKGFASIQAGSGSTWDQWSYTFTFAPGRSVSDFSIDAFDVGDFNPSRATEHSVTLTAYNSNDDIVDVATKAFTSDGAVNPSQYHIPGGEGDACAAERGDPGFFGLSVSDPEGIVRIELTSTGQDPKVGFDNIDFQTCTRTIGFWKNHAWPASVSVGGDTIAQCDGSDRREPCTGEKEGILWSAKGKDFSMLCSQLIAAKLNCADGDCTHDGVVSAAEQFLADEGVSCLTESTWQFDSKSQKHVASALASDLDDFNNDFHCVVD